MRVLRAPTVGLITTLIGCAAALPSRNAAIFQTQEARYSMKSAPDLFAAAERSWNVAVEYEDEDEQVAADDYRTRANLLLQAAVVEAKRIDVEQELASTRRQIQLASIRMDALSSAGNTPVQGSRAATFKSEEPTALQRTAISLSVAQALGAEPGAVDSLRARIKSLSMQRQPSSESIEMVQWEIFRLLGHARARQPEPSRGTTRAFFRSAAELSMQIERTDSGTAVAGRFSRSGPRTFRGVHRRMQMLVDGFPHGPVRCAMAGLSGRSGRNMLAEVQALEESSNGRVSVNTHIDSSREPELRCIFSGYSQP